MLENKSDDEWLDTDDEEEYLGVIEKEPILGYVDKSTGKVTKVDEDENLMDDDSTEEENVGWEITEVNNDKSETYSKLVDSLEQKIELLELDQILENLSEESSDSSTVVGVNQEEYPQSSGYPEVTLIPH